MEIVINAHRPLLRTLSQYLTVPELTQKTHENPSSLQAKDRTPYTPQYELRVYNTWAWRWPAKLISREQLILCSS